MIPDQQKERDAIRVIINRYKEYEIEFTEHNDAYAMPNADDFEELLKVAQSYRDHFEQIQALKSGEWMLVPKAILEVNDIPDDFRKVLEDNLFDLLA